MTVGVEVVERHQFDTYKAYFMLKGFTRLDHIIDSDKGQIIGFRNEAFDRAKEEILREYGFNMDDGYVEIYARRRIGLQSVSLNVY